MKYLISILFFIQIWLFASAQDANNHVLVKTDIFDQAGLKITVKSKALSYKCGCEFNKNKNKQCNLYIAKIDTLIFINDKSLLSEVSTLKTDSYFLIQSELDKFTSDNQQAIVTVFLSHYGYFIVNAIYPLNTIFTIENGNILTGTSPCKHLTLMNKIQYKLGINRKKIIKRLKDIEPKDNIFWREIEHLQKTGSY